MYQLQHANAQLATNRMHIAQSVTVFSRCYLVGEFTLRSGRSASRSATATLCPAGCTSTAATSPCASPIMWYNDFYVVQ